MSKATRVDKTKSISSNSKAQAIVDSIERLNDRLDLEFNKLGVDKKTISKSIADAPNKYGMKISLAKSQYQTFIDDCKNHIDDEAKTLELLKVQDFAADRLIEKYISENVKIYSLRELGNWWLRKVDRNNIRDNYAQYARCDISNISSNFTQQSLNLFEDPKWSACDELLSTYESGEQDLKKYAVKSMLN